MQNSNVKFMNTCLDFFISPKLPLESQFEGLKCLLNSNTSTVGIFSKIENLFGIPTVVPKDGDYYLNTDKDKSFKS